jgi:hypothetical protein
MLVRLSGSPNFPDSLSPHVYKAPLSKSNETFTYGSNTVTISHLNITFIVSPSFMLPTEKYNSI